MGTVLPLVNRDRSGSSGDWVEVTLPIFTGRSVHYAKLGKNFEGKDSLREGAQVAVEVSIDVFKRQSGEPAFGLTAWRVAEVIAPAAAAAKSA